MSIAVVEQICCHRLLIVGVRCASGTVLEAVGLTRVIVKTLRSLMRIFSVWDKPRLMTMMVRPLSPIVCVSCFWFSSCASQQCY
jgi:hypothetical protein